jgi:hypothetical protein
MIPCGQPNAKSVFEPRSMDTPRTARHRDCQGLQTELGSTSIWQAQWDLSIDGHRYLFVGIEQPSDITLRIGPIDQGPSVGTRQWKRRRGLVIIVCGDL